MSLPDRKFEGHTGFVTGVIHIPGRKQIVTCSDDDSLRVWDTENGKQVGNDWSGGGMVIAIALSPDGKKVVSGSRDGAVRLWNIDTGKAIAKWTGHTSYVTSVCWNGGRQVVSGCHNGTARVWNVEKGKTILGPIETGLTLVRVVHSPDETMIATGGYSEEKEFIKIWDTKTGKLITNLKGHQWAVHCLAWTADGRTLVSGSFDGSIKTWNTKTWKKTADLTGHADVVNVIAISPNDRIVASASWDKTARLWDLESGQPIGKPFQHADEVNCVSFSADGKLLATGCGDHKAYTWDVSAILNDLPLKTKPASKDGDIFQADATRPPGQPRIKHAHRVPRGFFDDSSLHLQSPGSNHPSPSSALPPRTPGTLLSRISSLFRLTHYTSPDKRNDEGIELQERRPKVVDVPFTKGKRRNISAAEIRLKKEKAKRKKASGGNSRPPQSSVSQQSGGAAQAQASSQHPAVSTSSAAPAVAATSTSTTTSRPDIMITQAGRWTRFRLFICCVSAKYSDGHH